MVAAYERGTLGVEMGTIQRLASLGFAMVLGSGGCASPPMPAPRNPSNACLDDAPVPTSASSPGWPCWPQGMTPDDASLYVTNEGDVSAEPEVAWAWLTRPELWPTWFPRATNVHVERGGPVLEVGSVVRWDMLGSTIRVTVTRAEPPNVLAWEG